jgi:hypothetical protein
MRYIIELLKTDDGGIKKECEVFLDSIIKGHYNG